MTIQVATPQATAKTPQHGDGDGAVRPSLLRCDIGEAARFRRPELWFADLGAADCIHPQTARLLTRVGVLV